MEEPVVPASLAEIQKQMVLSWGQSDPLTMNTGDFAYFETEQRIELLVPKVVLKEGITVGGKIETNNEFNYTFFYQSAVISGDQTQQATREDKRCIAKTSVGCNSAPASSVVPVTNLSTLSTSKPSADSLAPLAFKAFNKMKATAIKPMAADLQLSLGFEKFIALAYACQKTDSVTKYCVETLGADSCDITCSNLKSEDEIQDLPPLIQAQPNCGGYPDCKIKVKRVSFDWNFILVRGTVTQTQKINYTIAISPDLPFLSRVVDYCSRGLIDVPQIGSKVLVNICSKLKNYQPAP